MTSISASGDIKNYQISAAIIFLLGLVVVYIVSSLSPYPYYVSVVAIFIQVLLFISRFLFARKHLNISIIEFSNEVLRPIVIVTSAAVILPLLLKHYIAENSLLIITGIIADVLYIGLLIFLLGMSRAERQFVIELTKKLLKL